MGAPEPRQAGQSLVETLVGIIFLIPLVLFMIDVGVLVLGNIANDHLAKQCARAAASAVPAGSQTFNPGAYATQAKTSAEAVVTRQQASMKGFITGMSGEWICYDTQAATAMAGHNGAVAPTAPPAPGAGFVAVETSMTVQPPVPFPFLGTTRTFLAKDVEPIVSKPATTQTNSIY
jgi:ammonia channel protein AmtB